MLRKLALATALTASMTTAAVAGEMKDVVDTAAADERFSTLVEAVQAAEFGDAHDWRRASYRLAGMARMAMQFGRWADGNYLTQQADAAWACAEVKG